MERWKERERRGDGRGGGVDEVAEDDGGGGDTKGWSIHCCYQQLGELDERLLLPSLQLSCPLSLHLLTEPEGQRWRQQGDDGDGENRKEEIEG